jgi:cytidylate kinase
MKKDEHFVITINRELGSGGRTVGEKLAKKLDVPFYDKALVKALEKEYHLTVEEIERLKGQKDNWWTDFKRKVMLFDETAKAQYYKIGNDGQPELITSEAMFKTESRLLEEIASAESCVIAGRSGFYVFRKHPNHLSILIQAPMESRIKRIMGKKPITKEEAEKIIKEVDKSRENYVNKFTGTSRYDTRNYDLVINMDGKTEEEAVDLILKYIG